MTAVLPTGIMEFMPDLSLRGGVTKQKQGIAQNCSPQANASAWGNQDPSHIHKRKLSNASDEGRQGEAEEESFPLQKRIKTEPKDDYELAEEECARKSNDSTLQTEASAMPEGWKYEQTASASPVFDRVPSFAADECHPFNDNCKQCVINEARHADLDNISLHRRRQIREFEQGCEEPLSNKIRVWTEKRLEKSQTVRGLPRGALRMEDEAFIQSRAEESAAHEATREGPHSRSRAGSADGSYEHQLSHDEPRGQHVIQHDVSRDHQVIIHDGQREQHVITSDHHAITNDHHVAQRGRLESASEEETRYIRYLLTHNPGGGPTIVTSESNAEIPSDAPPVSLGKQPITMIQTAPSMPVVLTSPGVPQEYVNGMGSFPRTSLPHLQPKTPKVAKKRSRQQASGSNFLARLGKGRHESPAMTSSKGKGNKKSFENGAENVIYHDDLSIGQFGQGSTILPHIEQVPGNQDNRTAEQYISDIQRPYCNIPDDHQVTHINGVMSLPATRETRYGITLGELKRRTGFPEYLTRVDLIAYVRQSKSAGRALLDKYNISTAGQKSRPTILSKMCENEARVLGDGICRMNTEYFPWKTLAGVASTKVVEEQDGEGKVDQKLKAIQNTRTMLKEMYDLMVENRDIACMKTFEVASHTFGTANILNHLTVFDRLFAEYQNNLIRKNSEKQ